MGTALAALLVSVPAAAPLAGQPAEWILDPRPVLEIGASATDERDQLGRVLDATLAADGGVWVLDGLLKEVRRFGPDGRWMGRIGGEGDGPGEFREPLALAVTETTLIVLDALGRRTRFDLDGALLGDDRIDVASVCGPDWSPAIGSLLEDGAVVVRCRERLFGRVRGEYRQTVGLVRVGGPGTGVDTLGWFPADTGRTDDGRVPVPRPYAPPVELLVADGGSRLFVASSDRPQVQVLTSSGLPLGTLDVPATSRPVTAADLERHVASMLRAGGTDNDQRVIREWAEGMPPAASTPVLRSLLARGADEAWVEAWGDGGEASLWWVFRGGGGPVARVRAPPGTEILEVRGDRVIGLWRDAFGVERVRVHALDRGR